MNIYQRIDTSHPNASHILERLIALRKRLDAEIPSRNLADTLILGTWNIREFDSSSFGERSPEAMTYIAEIVNRFDLVAIQEVRKDLKALDHLVDLLGRDQWDYIFTDITEGSPGNKERMAYLYDKRKVSFGGLAAELVLPPIRMKDESGNTVYQPVNQVARTPFIVGFRSGDTTFILVSVHILYGSSKANDEERIKEIRHVAQFLRNRAEDPSTWSKNLIILGDFNIFGKDDKTLEALTAEGFTIPPIFEDLGSNIKQDKIFDQIAFHVRPDRFATTGKAGVFNFFKTVFREEDEKAYIKDMGEAYLQNARGKERDEKGQKRYYNTYWRTHQMSDHFPLWVELKINFTQEYLQEKLAEAMASQATSKSIFAPESVSIDEREHAAIMGSDLKEPTYENFSGIDYRDIDLRNMQMSGMNLSAKDFSGAKFGAAVLSEADLSRGRFVNSDFTDANLHLANMSGGDFTDAIFLRTNLQNANCFEADFTGAQFEKANFLNCILDDALLSKTSFKHCKFNASQKQVLESAEVELLGNEFL